MKKTLLFIIFALSTAFIIAQTVPHKKMVANAPVRCSLTSPNYSSSLFTKTSVPIVTVDFSAVNTGYSTGVLTGGSDGHGEYYDYAVWQRWANVNPSTLISASSTYATLTSDYFGGLTNFISYMTSYLDTTVSSAENGWMMIAPYEQTTQLSGNFNAFIRIDSIDATAASLVDIQFFQYYHKYFDHCYIDYSTDGGSTWTEMEINTRGIDNATDYFRGPSTFTLPVAVAGNVISIRIRYKSLNSGHPFYGVFWALDDVVAYSCDANRLKQYGQEYVEGNYGMIPQNMVVNPAWYAQVRNNGAIAQTNVEAKLYHLDATQQQSTLVSTYNNGTINPPDTVGVIVDRSGWLNPDSLNWVGWYSNINHTPHGTGVALPTATVGDNYMYVELSTDSLSFTYDTMYYRVTAANADNEYVWAHDNGVLAYTPDNHFVYGFAYDGTVWYASDDPDEVHFYDPGYTVTLCYTTDQVVPDGWVIRGVELVASPKEGYYSNGARISATLLQDDFNDGPTPIVTGANAVLIGAADVNGSSVIGRNSNGYLDNGAYNTIFIPFPDQPVLTPNTSYRVGYTIEEDGYFAVAQEARGYYYTASTIGNQDSIVYFAANESTAKWSSHFGPNQYQILITDPHYGGTGSISMYTYRNVDYCPMIRLVVGPPRVTPQQNIEINCGNEDYGSVYYENESVCGTTITPAQGSAVTLTAESAANCIIDQVVVDGVAVEPYNEETGQGDPNYSLYFDENIDVYIAHYTFQNITADHTFSVVFEHGSQEGIDPVAANVRMSLQPNPATSQVNLNIEGVEGGVSCMIIDMSGRVVYNQNFDAANQQTLNVSHLAKGAYFVRITNDKFSKVEKLIVR